MQKHWMIREIADAAAFIQRYFDPECLTIPAIMAWSILPWGRRNHHSDPMFPPTYRDCLRGASHGKIKARSSQAEQGQKKGST